jgi:long-subunit acyl-CoA synthetase (AMP-forming)
MIAWNTPTRQRIASVGKPIHADHVHFTPESEIVIRRPHPLSKGYFDSAEEDRAATFQPDGAIMTGDIGTLDADGFLSLSGRKKEIIVTSGGAKFHPETLERALLEIGGITHAVVTMAKGDGRIAAVLVSQEHDDAAARARIDSGVAALNERLPSYQRIHRVVLTGAAPSIDNGMLTRNLKCDRRGVYRYHEAAIEGRAA